MAAFLTIKQLGTNGGGFFGPNSTHPFENPSFWTNALEMISIIIIPMACVWMFGRIVGRMRHAAIVFGVMLVLLVAKTVGAVYFESTPTQAFAGLPIEQNVGNLEGKEMRFGATSGPTWAVLTTSTSNGSVGAMQDSLNPMTGLFPMIGMWLNETFGGVGVGMINMFLYIVVGVFMAGMMVGRTPEYLGWRVEAREVKFAILALLAHGFFILVGTAIFAATPWGADNAQQCRSARLQRDALRVQLGKRQQWFGLRRAGRQHRALERRHRHRHAARPVHSDHPAARDRRLAHGEAAHGRIGRHARRGRRHLRRHAARHDPGRRRSDLLSGRDARDRSQST